MDNKQLKALLKVLRENGVLEYSSPEISFKFSQDFLISKDKPSSLQTELNTDDPYANFPDGELTPDELAYYSTGGKPPGSDDN